MKTKKIRQFAWVISSSVLCGICFSGIFLILWIALIFWSRGTWIMDPAGWWGVAMFVGIALGLGYHTIFWMNAGKKRKAH